MTSRQVEDLDRAPTHSLMAVLRVRDFRNLWLGLGLSSFGDWLGLAAITAMAHAESGQLATVLGGGANSYQLENFAISGVLFLRVMPALLLSPIAGYVADRLDRRWVMIVGDFVRAALFLSMPIVGSLYWVFAATVLIEAVSVVWGPVKDSTVPNLVPRNRLEAANQLSVATTYGTAPPAFLAFSSLSLFSQFIGDNLGGFHLNAVSIALYVNALSFAVSGVVIMRLRTIPKGAAAIGEEEAGPIRVIINGWKYVGRTPLVRGLVTGIVGAFAAGGVIVGLARTFVADLGGGNTGFGFLSASVFVGLGLGMWQGPRLLQGLSRRRLFGLALSGAGLVLLPLALVQDLTGAISLAVVIGFLAGVGWITGNTMLGLEVPDEWRGRTFALVGSLIRLALSVVLAVGPLLAGLIGRHRIDIPQTQLHYTYNGAAWTFLISAVAMFAVGVTSYRQMDDRKGIALLSDLRSAMTSSPGVYTATGVFVAFEGGEGTGKSTQTRLLSQWLEEQGYQVVRTYEPGDSQVGGQVRRMLLDPQSRMADRTEALLYAADKAEHVEQVIAPALSRGDVVVCDRYVDSTLAYQGAGRGHDVNPATKAQETRRLERVARWATGDLRPHLTVLLDLPPEEGFARFSGRDRIEAESADFHERVREAFLRLATAKPENYLILDAQMPPEQIAAAVRQRLSHVLGQASRPAESAEPVEGDQADPNDDADRVGSAKTQDDPDRTRVVPTLEEDDPDRTRITPALTEDDL